MSDRIGYGLTQEEATAMGMPRCPYCGRLADARSDVQFFMYDVTAVRCSSCRAYHVEGSDDPWVRMPALDVSNYGEKAAAVWGRLEAMAMAMHDKRGDR